MLGILHRCRRSGAVLVVAAAFAVVAPAAAEARLPVLQTGAAFEVRPAVVGGWTGDGTGFLGGSTGHPNSASQNASDSERFGRVKWTTWNRHKAVGRAVVWIKNCNPDCAGGTWEREPRTNVRAFRVRNSRFTRLRFAYDAGSGRRTVTFKLRVPNDDWI